MRENEGRMIVQKYGESNSRHIEIACGQCIECRLSKARQWGQRADKEAATSDKPSWFITLTYEEKYLKWGTKKINKITGEVTEESTINKRDIQLWMKKIRKKYGQGIKYMICGEYGPKTKRPHYHGIIIGLEIKDIKQKKYTKYLESKELEKTWGKGHITIAKYQFEVANYTAGYILKKQTGQKKYDHKETEFLLTSRRPGLGKKWFDENYKKVYENDEVFIKTNKGVIKTQPNGYYDKLLKKIDEELYNQTKQKRVETALAKYKPKQELSEYEQDIVRSDNSEQKHKKGGGRGKI